jgi:hypothetical protein
VPVGLPKRGINALLCEVGNAKRQEHAAKLEPRKAEGRVTLGSVWLDERDVRRVKKKPNIRARFLDVNTGKVVRLELGRWLLGSSIPVAHKNGDPLDFRIENLEARETEKQRKRSEGAAAKRAKREAKKAERAAKRAKHYASRPSAGPDGFTPEQQLGVLLSEDFRKELVRIAGAIVRDQMDDGTAERPTDEKRGEELVSEVVGGVINRVRAGTVRNVREYTKWSVRVQARLEMGKVWYKLGHVKRPRSESRTLSDVEAQEQAAIRE